MIQSISYRGKTLEELNNMSIKEFAELLPARQRRSLIRGLKPGHKKFLQRLNKASKPLKTHLRNMIILPEMIGKNVLMYNGKEYISVRVEIEMLGHYMGEFALTRKVVRHSAPGIGATKSSAAVSVR